MAAPRQPEPAHGTRARYNAFRAEVRCRCAACRAANASYFRTYREPTPPAPGPPPPTQRRAGHADQLELPDEYLKGWR